MLYAKVDDTHYHRYNCVMGLCASCGTKNWIRCPKELSTMEKMTSVKVFEDIEANFKGEVRKKRMLLERSCKDLTDLFIQSLRKFSTHTFIYVWQTNQFKKFIANLTNDMVILVVDFVENYTFKEKNEIQSMHWFSIQVSIFVTLALIGITKLKFEL